MLISRREAAARIGAATGLSRRRAGTVLDAGLAGEPVLTRAATLFESAAVERLVGRSWLSPQEEATRFPYGVLVSRRTYHVLRDDPLETLSDGWDLSRWTGVWIRHLISEHGHLPMLAAICGFVVAGAWFPTGPGHEWTLRLPPEDWGSPRGKMWG